MNRKNVYEYEYYSYEYAIVGWVSLIDCPFEIHSSLKRVWKYVSLSQRLSDKKYVVTAEVNN